MADLTNQHLVEALQQSTTELEEAAKIISGLGFNSTASLFHTAAERNRRYIASMDTSHGGGAGDGSKATGGGA